MSTYKLVITDSPVRAEALAARLGREFKILATWGHLEDLPWDQIGVDLSTSQFVADFRFLDSKRQVVAVISQSLEEAESVYLATENSPDGEAIAAEVNLYCEQYFGERPVFRVDPAVFDGKDGSVVLNDGLLTRHYSRRILDRILSYVVSPLATTVLGPGTIVSRLSATALCVIAERQRAFEKAAARVQICLNGMQFGVWFVDAQGSKSGVLDRERTEKMVLVAPKLVYWITKMTESERIIPAPKPFDMPSLLGFVEAELKLSVSMAKTALMDLQERCMVTVDSEVVPAGIITAAHAFLRKEYGIESVITLLRGLAPVVVALTSITGTKEQVAIYDLIRRRFLASLLPSARERCVQVFGLVGRDKEHPLALALRGEGAVPEDIGYRRLWHEDAPVIMKTAWNEGAMPHFESVHVEPVVEAFTPGSLVSYLGLEGLGSGKYGVDAVEYLIEREYVKTDVDGRLKITQRGSRLVEFLESTFGPVFGKEYTREVESGIEQGSGDELLQSYWDTLRPLVYEVGRRAKDIAEARQSAEISGEQCPRCGKALIRLVRADYGETISCADYPVRCSFTRGNGRAVRATVATH